MHDIYIVEDNDLDVELVREALSDAGVACTVHVASDGEKGLRLLERAGRDLPRPALIVLDLNIPRLGGLELLARVRAEPSLAAIPVVVLSGSLNPRERDAALAQGATAFIQKPGDVDGFLAVGRNLASMLPPAPP